MRHFILASAGTHGDVFPFVALGIALRARGHRVTLAVNEPHRQMAIDHGFQFVPLVSETETNEFLAAPDLWHPVKCGMVGARWGNRCLRQQYETLSRLASDTDSVMAAAPEIIAARVVPLGAGKMLERERATCTRIARETVTISQQDMISQCRMFAGRSGGENAVDTAAK